MSNSFNNFRTVVGMISMFVFAVYAVVSVYWTYRLYLARSDIILHKRRVNLSLLTNITLVISFFLYTFLLGAITIDVGYSYHWTYHAAIFIHFCAMYVCVWRFTLLSFDINWYVSDVFYLFLKCDTNIAKKRTVSMINMEWHKLLNPTTLTTNFFIRHKKTLGNSRFVRNVVCTMLLVTFIVLLIPTLGTEKVSTIGHDMPENEVDQSKQSKQWGLFLALMTLGLFGIPEIGLVVIMINTPVFHDAFLVRTEMKLFTSIVLVDLSIYFLVSMLHYKFQMEGTAKTNLEFILDVLLFNSVGLAFFLKKKKGNFIGSMITTYWVLIRIQPLMHTESVESLIKVKSFHKSQEQKFEDMLIEMSSDPIHHDDQTSPLSPIQTVTMEMANGCGHIGDMPLSPRLHSHGYDTMDISQKADVSPLSDRGRESIKLPLLSKLPLSPLQSNIELEEHRQTSKNDISLKMVLKHVKAFEAFMAYLAKGICFFF
ncbi:hypothetical protein RFI_15896 [Reticulomyxa filosa]|uniref:Uncharacterized protein n=1 Tax=Reticulomyxa filosa TaxID=46433 RepID=X6N5V1_RETFI|nr:hypothetical protein RFI_15896 [Reticulomyxa filosa]|eukprot:ETO21308.1 hypothetical protein RFI_15896 [Reticulomyxa filosa]